MSTTQLSKQNSHINICLYTVREDGEIEGERLKASWIQIDPARGVQQCHSHVKMTSLCDRKLSPLTSIFLYAVLLHTTVDGFTVNVIVRVLFLSLCFLFFSPFSSSILLLPLCRLLLRLRLSQIRKSLLQRDLCGYADGWY